MGSKQPEECKAFFKVYLPHSAKKICIPRAYVSYMKGNIPQTSSLRNQYGKIWPVKVEKIEDDFFFADGWDKYVRDNSLEEGEFIVFQYDRHMIYDVILYGKNGPQKNVAGYVAIEEEEEEEEEEEDDAKSESESKANKGKGKSSRLHPFGAGTDIFKSVPKPKNPYFVTKIKPRRRNELHVPHDFLRKHNLTLPSETTLHDEKGRKWKSELQRWKDGRHCYYGGWGILCSTNAVGGDDICICELKKGSDGVQFFKVQVVQGARRIA